MGINAAPKGDMTAKFPLEFIRVHMFGRDLHRIEGVGAHIDDVGHNPIDRAAAMIDQFG